jgi:hypothetical protein
VLIALAACTDSLAAPRSGEAVVAAKVGAVSARVLTGSVHEGRTESKKLSAGQSVGEGSLITTGKDGNACIVLSPGAILCVAPGSQLTLSQLRHASDGLPTSEDDLIRRIHIDLKKGRVLVHAGVPTPTLDVRIRTAEGEVDASGGTFVVAQSGDGEWAFISDEHNQFVTPQGGTRTELREGEALFLSRRDGQPALEKDADLLESPLREFEICSCYFDDLETYLRDPLYFDRAGLREYLGTPGGIDYIGSNESVVDVSPSYRRTVFVENRVETPPGTSTRGGRWDTPRAWAWSEQTGVLKGVNYIPRDAVNSTEMWMADSFDREVIDQELGWAREAGYTALRVQLQYVVWKEDPQGFLDRFDEFLDLAEKHDLRVVPVLFDDKNLANADPAIGVQPDPVPGQHNARWTPSPGRTAAVDRAVWPDLERYVKSVVGEFRRDDRIVYWDLYNRTGDDGMWEQTLPLMDQTFNWARAARPDQPLAAAAWTRMESAMSTRMLERSDIITFQSFDDATQVEALLLLLKRYDRPVICADWLMRQRDSTFEKLLPLFSVHRVGWFNRGLVRGKTQEWVQQETLRSSTAPDLWQHDVLDANGEAYRDNELELIQGFRYYSN